MYSLVPRRVALVCPAVVAVSVYLSIKQAAPVSLRGKFEYLLYILPDFMYFLKECVSAYGSTEAATKKASSHTRLLSAGTALLDKHRLTAQVVNAKPAGCDGGEPEAL